MHHACFCSHAFRVVTFKINSTSVVSRGKYFNTLKSRSVIHSELRMNHNGFLSKLTPRKPKHRAHLGA